MTDAERWLRRQLAELDGPVPPTARVWLLDNGRDPAPPIDPAAALVACVRAPGCAACRRPWTGEPLVQAVFQGRPLCVPCALVSGDPAAPRIFVGWRPKTQTELAAGAFTQDDGGG